MNDAIRHITKAILKAARTLMSTALLCLLAAVNAQAQTVEPGGSTPLNWAAADKVPGPVPGTIMPEQYASAVGRFIYNEESLAIFRELGDNVESVSQLHNLGYTALALNDDRRAETIFAEALGMARDLRAQREIYNIIVGSRP